MLHPFFEVYGPRTKDTKIYMSVNYRYQEDMVMVKNNGHR